MLFPSKWRTRIRAAIHAFIAFNMRNGEKKEMDPKANAHYEELERRIRELTKMNKEIIQLNRLEKFAVAGRIANTIAHEIKNPLTSITLATSELADEFKMDESNIFIDIINRNNKKIHILINNFLNATKLPELCVRNISINDLIDEVLRIARDRIRQENIQVEIDYSTDIREVSVDSNKIKTAFLNIMLNAIEAMAPGKGVLYIRTEEREGKCIVIIKDNGDGMDEETVSKLFEPYFSTKRLGKGLGLAQVQSIILSHQGSIEVQSEPGKGTSFTISLNFYGNPA